MYDQREEGYDFLERFPDPEVAMDNSTHDDRGRVTYWTAPGPDDDDRTSRDSEEGPHEINDGPVMLIAIIALLAFAAGFWVLWSWSWHEIGYWTLAAIGVPVLILTAFTVATRP
jgi:hypothetical protein